MRESTIRTRCLKWLNSLPQSYFVVSPPGSPTGWPDISGVVQGRPVFVETKVAGNKAKKHQAYVHRKLREAGAVVIVPHYLEELQDEIEAWLGIV